MINEIIDDKVQKAREKNARYRAEHLDELREKQRMARYKKYHTDILWQNKVKDEMREKYKTDMEYHAKILERRRKYVELNKEKIKAKQCTDEYKTYHRRKMCEYYQKNPDKFKERNRKNFLKYKPEVLVERKRKALLVKKQCVEYLGGKCEICGYDFHLAALQFHHINPTEKEFELTKRICNGQSVEILHEELDKCCLLCANCHSIVSYNQQQDERERIIGETK